MLLKYKLSHARELLLCYTSKKVTSKLHKLTNYKSNYTRTMYIKVITSLYKVMQTNGKTRMTRWFYPEVHVLANTLVPVVSTAHLVRRLIGITRQIHTSSITRTYPESEGSSMTRSKRAALRDPHGVSTIPLTNLPLEHRIIFSRASLEWQATKPSRRWQPPRVTITTGLQLDHLVPLDATH